VAAAPAEVGGVDPSRNFVEAAIAQPWAGSEQGRPWHARPRMGTGALGWSSVVGAVMAGVLGALAGEGKGDGDLSSGETPSPLPTRPDLAAMVDLCSSVFLRAQSECLTEEEDRGADE